MTFSNDLVVRFLNVGQGDSTHIVLPTGEHMLIDINLDAKHGGIDVIEYLADQLPAVAKGKKQRLDYLVITHPHDDHICGIGDLRDRFDIGEMWHSGHELDCEEGENPNYDEYVALIDDLGDKAIKVCAQSDVWRTIGDATFHVYRPSSYVSTQEDWSSDEKRNAIHNECMVVKLTRGGTAVMFTGDSHKGAWESIVKHYEKDGQLVAKVLHASHHGSRTFFKDSSEDDAAWTDHLDAIEPEYVVVSVGADNQHDHPHDDMMDEYEARVGGEGIYRTDHDLSIELCVDSSGLCSWEFDPDSLQENYQLDDEDDDDRSGGTAVAARVEKSLDNRRPAKTSGSVLPARLKDIPAIDTLAHRKPVPWPVQERFACEIICESFHASGGGKSRAMLHPRVPKRTRLEFRVRTNAPTPYDVQWQVTNSGAEARNANQLRGDFYPGSGGRHGEMRTETTQYHGSHLVQAFVVKDGRVVARSDEILVRVEKK
jgi:beta-lactamase superfamily II metal-dependent hydrolase